MPAVLIFSILQAKSEKVAWNSSPRVDSSDDKKVYEMSRPVSSPSIPTGKLDFNKRAKPKVASITDHKPTGGQKKITTQKVNFREKAQPKVGSLDNAQYKPTGGDVKVSMNRQ